MSDIQYRPRCYKCRADAGKEPAGVKPNELCPSHLEAFALPLLDPMAIDEAWLRSVGFTQYGMFLDGWGGHEGGLQRWCLEWHCNREWRIDGRVFSKDKKTRGELRMLCAALGITLQPGEVQG